MALAHQHNPLIAMREFLDRVTPFDPAPGSEEAVAVEVRVGTRTERFALTEHVGRALAEALYRYYDPADVGPCDRCGSRRLDENLQCRDCGHVNGVFGQVLLEHAEKIRREGRELDDGPGVGW